MTPLGVKSDENVADSVGFSSISHTESNQREDCVVFECRQLTLVRGRDAGHRPGVKSVSREEIRLELILALTDVLIQIKQSYYSGLFSSFFKVTDIVTKKIIFKVARQKKQKAKT